MSSWKVVHQCVLTRSHWWTTFQLLSLWLSMSTGLWLQTTLTHASSKSPSSRFHNFYVSQLYRAYIRERDHMLSRRLCRVVKLQLQITITNYSRYTDTTVCWNLDPSWVVTSHVYFNLSISEVTFDVAWLWKVRGRFALVRSTPYLH